jgi:hypothetical protein
MEGKVMYLVTWFDTIGSKKHSGTAETKEEANNLAESWAATAGVTDVSVWLLLHTYETQIVAVRRDHAKGITGNGS